VHGSVHAGDIAFTREHIKVFVRSDKIRVEGTYTFSNPDSFPRRHGLFYPFPIDSLHPTVDSITVRSGDDTVPFSRGGNGISFVIAVPGNGSVSYDVSYEQACLDGSGCYILTSTAAWNTPLEHAGFEIYVPDTLQLDWVSYEIDDISEENAFRVHVFSRVDFMPDEDLCLRWHVRGP
jgi:hypothetical protein